MRKTASILLLMLIVFNTVGYKLWLNYALQKADIALEASLDKNNYNQQDLFTLKIPLHLPYQNVGAAFERIDGEITVNGESYKYVQRKVQNDTLFLQCIKHIEKNNLEQKFNDYFAKVNGVAGSSDPKKIPGKNSGILKFSVADFITNDRITLTHINYLNIDTVYTTKTVFNCSLTHLQKLIKPPQTV